MLHSLRIRKSLINVNNPQAAQAQFPQWKLGVKGNRLNRNGSGKLPHSKQKQAK